MIYHKGYFPCFSGKSIFFYPILQYCQFSWNRVPSENERSKKKTDAFFGFGMKNFIFSNVVFHFLRSNLDFTTKRKKFFLKSREISMIFLLRNAISPDPLVRFRWFFLQTADNFILFPITKKKVSEIFKFSKKIRNRDFWSKKPPNWQNCKFLT